MQFDEDALHHVRETRLLIEAYDRWILEEIEPYLGNRILEVGCGLGNMLTHFLERELVVGIDNSAGTILEAKRKFASYSNVQFHEYSITDPSVLELNKYRFDTAFSLNVLEHVEDDILAMRHILDMLQAGSRFILIVPAHEWLYGTMDISIGHYRRYSKGSAAEKLAIAGFRIIEQKYMNMLGALGWFVNGKLLRKQVPPSGQLRLLNIIVPVIRHFESIVQIPFGISLITVAEA